ncbi:MAG: alpha/beta hydrolase, partial [Terrimicrobiaceae bacterium]|nr:alpha/beta hydrolase [Terrimicrobiaceae bacterium]
MRFGFWRWAFLVVALALFAAGWLLAAAASWKQNRLAELAAAAESGAVMQVAERGEGFPVLVVHGAPGGYDQALAVAEGLGLEGFRVIAPSRPGFLG